MVKKGKNRLLCVKRILIEDHDFEAKPNKLFDLGVRSRFMIMTNGCLNKFFSWLPTTAHYARLAWDILHQNGEDGQ